MTKLYFIADNQIHIYENNKTVTMPYKNNYGRFAELIAVKVDNLVEYAEADSDNEEF